MRNEAESARIQVIAAVDEAFDGVCLEEGVSLHEADAIDNYSSNEQRPAARAVDTAIDWRDVPQSELERIYWVWPFFDAKGFRFHLPAAMLWSMNAIIDRQANTTSLDFVIWALTPNGDPDHDSIFHEHVRLLSDAQANAIRQFLQWFANYSEEFWEDACQSLESYWDYRTMA